MWIPAVILTPPALAKVGIVFAGLLAATKFGLPLGWAMICSSIALTFWAGAGVGGLAEQLDLLLQTQSVLLLAVVLGILALVESLNQTGRMKLTIDALRAWLARDKLLYAAMPALMGILPMPGGALITAPIVGSIDSTNSLSGEHKTAINYWFRHVWEYWWPLYPGVILGIAISGIPPGVYYLAMLPLTAVSLGVGYSFILRRITGRRSTGHQALDIRAASALLWPVALLVVASIASSTILPLAGVPGAEANLWGLLSGLITALGIMHGRDLSGLKGPLRALVSSRSVSLALVVAGILLFSAALRLPTAGGNGPDLVSLMRDELQQVGIPLILILALLPFISGLVTGIAMGFVGTSFPLVFELIGADPPLNAALATAVISFAFGYAGMLLSPVHICLVVTSEYFQSQLTHVYRYLVRPVAVLLIAASLLAGVYYIAL